MQLLQVRFNDIPSPRNKMKAQANLNQISNMTEASTYTHSKKVELYQVFCTFCLTCTTAFQ